MYKNPISNKTASVFLYLFNNNVKKFTLYIFVCYNVIDNKREEI